MYDIEEFLKTITEEDLYSGPVADKNIILS